MIEAGVQRALRYAWENVNYLSFREALKPPVVELSDAARLGAWNHATRTISISRALVREHPWGVVVEVLKHEMAHQYAHEILDAVDETAHGPAFRWVCERLNIDPASGGLPVAPGEEPRVMRRVRKLLALAESPNPNEAQAAMNAAQRLMLEHNLSVRPARYTFRHLGRASARMSDIDNMLGGLLGAHFFVSPIIVSAYDVETNVQGSVLEICGTPENLDMAAYVYDFLLETAGRLWRDHTRRGLAAGERERQRYVVGVIRGFREKLAQSTAQSAETGLVWLGDPGREAWTSKRHPRVRTTRRKGKVFSEAELAGRNAGKQIVLNRPIKEGPSGGGPKLLG